MNEHEFCSGDRWGGALILVLTSALTLTMGCSDDDGEPVSNSATETGGDGDGDSGGDGDGDSEGDGDGDSEGDGDGDSGGDGDGDSGGDGDGDSEGDGDGDSGGDGDGDTPECGDGVVEGDEACDDGNEDNTDACLDSCEEASCGDGFVQAGVEACDDGNEDNSDACLDSCVEASCGDGFVQAGVEACDDGNEDNSDACLDSCVEASCGDSFVQEGVEACDDGNEDDTDACLGSCVAASCGDGVIWEGEEQCDDEGPECFACLDAHVVHNYDGPCDDEEEIPDGTYTVGCGQGLVVYHECYTPAALGGFEAPHSIRSASYLLYDPGQGVTPDYTLAFYAWPDGHPPKTPDHVDHDPLLEIELTPDQSTPGRHTVELDEPLVIDADNGRFCMALIGADGMRIRTDGNWHGAPDHFWYHPTCANWQTEPDRGAPFEVRKYCYDVTITQD